MKTEILAIGNEVLCGDVVNTNASWLSEQLSKKNIEVIRHQTIGDHDSEIERALLSPLPDTKEVIVTGGLGPTVDDFTLEIAAKAFQKPLQTDIQVLEGLRKKFEALGRPMTPNQEKQARIPTDGIVLKNRWGTAPGVQIEFNGVDYFFLPGVPKEMKQIFEDSVLPVLMTRRKTGKTFLTQTLRCFGTEEAKLDSLLKPLLKNRVQLSNCKIAFRLYFPEIWIKLSASGDTEQEAKRFLEESLQEVRSIIGGYIYGEENETLEGQVGKLLKKERQTLSIAESCTGGMVANQMTNIPGSSDYFLGGIVTYSNSSKVDLLSVRPETIQNFGAVSAETAIEMSEGVRQKLKSSYGIGITGIAGPDGGTKEKPVGTVYIALTDQKETRVKQFFFPHDREWFKKRVTSTALNWLRVCILEKSEQ